MQHICAFCSQSLITQHKKHHCKKFHSLIPKITQSQNNSSHVFNNITNLVFQGGGVKGVAYLGALEELQTTGKHLNRDFLGGVRRIAGTSAGSIVALYLGLNMDVNQDIRPLMGRGYDTLLDDGLILKVKLDKCRWLPGLDHKNFKAKHIILKALKYFGELNKTLESGQPKRKEEARKTLQEAIKKVFRYYGEKLGFFPSLALKVKGSDFARDIVQWFFDLLEPPKKVEPLKKQVQVEEYKICQENLQKISVPGSEDVELVKKSTVGITYQEVTFVKAKSGDSNSEGEPDAFQAVTPRTFQEIVKEECSQLSEDDKQEISSAERSFSRSSSLSSLSNVLSQLAESPQNAKTLQVLGSLYKKSPSQENSFNIYFNNDLNQKSGLDMGLGPETCTGFQNNPSNEPFPHYLNESNAQNTNPIADNKVPLVPEGDLMSDVESSTKKVTGLEPNYKGENGDLREQIMSTAPDTNNGGSVEAPTGFNPTSVFDSSASPIFLPRTITRNGQSFNERSNFSVILPQEPSIADEKSVIKVKEEDAKEYIKINPKGKKKIIAAAPEEELTDDLLPTALGELLWFIIISQQNAAGVQEQLGLFDGSVIKTELIEKPIHDRLKKLELKPKDNLTFKELMDYNAELPKEKRFKQFYVTAFNTERCKTEVFSVEHTPNVVVADAVRASMSIPVFFSPVTIQEKDASGNLRERTYQGNVVHYMDGGILDNYPMWIFDDFKYCFDDDSRCGTALRYSLQNPHTLGFRLLDTNMIHEYTNHHSVGETITGQAKTKEYKEKFSYQIGLLLNTVVNEAQENEHLKRGDCTRSAYIDNKGVSAIAFSLGADQREALIESGRQSVRDYQVRAKNKFHGEGKIN